MVKVHLQFYQCSPALSVEMLNSWNVICGNLHVTIVAGWNEVFLELNEPLVTPGSCSHPTTDSVRRGSHNGFPNPEARCPSTIQHLEVADETD